VSLSEYHLVKGGQNLTKIDPSVPLHLYLSVFGMTGATSYYGTVGVLEVKEGDVFVVNAASGACGTVAGRIAKLRGAFVVGITSEGSKGEHIKKQFGFDEVINYKDYPTFDEFYKILKEKCPNGIDKYFDNVGGYQTDAVLKLLNKNGRIAICGQISYYNTQPYFPQFSLMETIYKTIRIEGFLVGDFFTKPEFGNYLKEMSEWVKTGQLVADDTIFKGFEEIPNAFLSLFTGNKVGKVIIQLSESK
jgi:NADPH:quinone reductase